MLVRPSWPNGQGFEITKKKDLKIAGLISQGVRLTSRNGVDGQCESTRPWLEQKRAQIERSKKPKIYVHNFLKHAV